MLAESTKYSARDKKLCE
jgi:hypothetical protein